MNLTSIVSAVILSATLTASADPGRLSIHLEFPDNSLSKRQKSVFVNSASRWERMLVGATNIPEDYTLTIEAKGLEIDGPGRILGQAGPTRTWNSDTRIAARGVMSFDKSDLHDMEVMGTLNNVITHEMAHVLGFGTLWSDLVDRRLPQGPIFLGCAAVREYEELRNNTLHERLRNRTVIPGVPLANTGGPGTYGGHWRESIFGNELMTGYIQGHTDPISRMTLGAFADMGYTVQLYNAEPYRLPTKSELSYLRRSAKEDFSSQVSAHTLSGAGSAL